MTIPASVYTAASVTGPTGTNVGSVLVQSLTVTSSGAKAFIFVNFVGTAISTGGVDSRVKVFRDGNLILDEEIPAAYSYSVGESSVYKTRVVTSYLDVPSVGIHTYQVYYYGLNPNGYTASAANRLFMYLETKR